MKNVSIEQFYTKINKNISLIGGYLDDKSIPFIFKACRLKPYSVLYDKYNNGRTKLERNWIDENGSSLVITENKRLNILFNDISISNNNIPFTDLYGGLTMKETIRISKLGYFFFDRDEDLNSEFFYCILVGKDNFFRTFTYAYGEMSRTLSPLCAGIPILKDIHKNLNLKVFREVPLDNKKHFLLPCQKPSSWLSSLPPQKGFLNIVRNNDNKVLLSNLIT